MSISTALGALGLVATIVFGWLSIYLFLAHRYPGQITFIREDVIPLFDSIVKNFPELAVLYKNKPVAEGLVLLKGVFVNSGSKDITNDMVSEKITLLLPQHHRWHSVKLISTSPSIHGKFELSDSSLTLGIDLFRCREFVRFEALAEVPIAFDENDKDTKHIGTRFVDALKIQHRIADTQKVRIRELPDEEYATRRFKRLRIPFALMLLVMCGLTVWEMTHPGVVLRYVVPNDGGTNTEVRATPVLNGTVILRGIQDTQFRKTVPVEAFLKTPNLTVRCVVDRETTMLVGCGVNLLMISGFLVFAYQDIRQARRLRKLFTTVESGKESP